MVVNNARRLSVAVAVLGLSVTALAVTPAVGAVTRVQPGSLSAYPRVLSGVDAVSATDAWAVGSFGDHALALHWGGSRWVQVRVPDLPGKGASAFAAVSATSGSDVWAVGHFFDGTSDKPLVEHWNGTAWTRMAGVNPIGATAVELSGVSALSATDAWAVGHFFNGTRTEILIEHWDGTRWTRATGPQVGHLFAVNADSPTDVWAVGVTRGLTLIEHWDGASWTRADDGVDPGHLLGVSADSPTDAWAVGHVHADNLDQTLVEHWNGSAWSRVSAPGICGGEVGKLYAVSVDSSTDGWAVGECGIEHWDGSTWTIVDGAPMRFRSAMFGVSALSPGDAWLVGNYATSPEFPTRENTLAEHWDGNAWTQVSTPNPGGASDRVLTAVDAESATDMWSVGYNDVTGRTVIEHGDGTTWHQVPSPSPGGAFREAELLGVSADAPDDAWAVGYFSVYGVDKTLIEHWDGTDWTTMPSPAICGGDSYCLNAVSAVSPTDVWAVGQIPNNGSGSRENVIEHWDGVRWRLVASPKLRDVGELQSVAAVSATDVWAVGWSRVSFSAHERTLIDHWDGTRWTRVPSPNPPSGYDNVLYSVSGDSATDAWAVGIANSDTLVEHWDGSQWSVVAAPDTKGGLFQGVVAVSPTDAWAVGNAETAGHIVALTDHWDGTTWTRTSSPNPGGDFDRLFGVTATSTSDAWSVGVFNQVRGGQSQSTALVEHWDGTDWTQP